MQSFYFISDDTTRLKLYEDSSKKGSVIITVLYLK